MRRSIIVLPCFLLSLAACAADVAPTTVRSGLDTDRPLADLDDTEVVQLCEAWGAHADAATTAQGGVLETLCMIGSTTHVDIATCEQTYAECVARGRSFLSGCAEGTTPVPDCEPEVTVGLYERCMTAAVDTLVDLELDCTLVNDLEEREARLAAWIPAPECAPFTTRECSTFGPPGGL